MNISDDIKLIHKIITNMVLFQKFKGDLTLEKSIYIIHRMKEKKMYVIGQKVCWGFHKMLWKKQKNFFSNEIIIFMHANKNEKAQHSIL